MTGVLAVALAVLASGACLTTVGVLLHRDLTEVAAQLSRANRHPPDIQRDLDQLWNDVHHSQAERDGATDKRLHDVGTALTQLRQTQDGLVRAVNWMVPLVKHWSGEGQR